MTARPRLDDRDPAEPQEWVPVSSRGMRRHVLAQTAAEIARVKDSRKKSITETEESQA